MGGEAESETLFPTWVVPDGTLKEKFLETKVKPGRGRI